MLPQKSNPAGMKIGKVIFAVCAAAVGVAALSLSACRSCSSRTLEGAAEVQAAPSAGEVPVAAGGERNDMRKEDVYKRQTVFDETLLHEDVTFSLADMLAHSTPVFIKSYGRGTMATLSLIHI